MDIKFGLNNILITEKKITYNDIHEKNKWKNK